MHADSAQEFQREEFFNTHAAGWEARNYPPEKLRQVDQLMSSLPLAQAEVIIDVGCGEGVLQPYLRKYARPDAALLALDPSPDMHSSRQIQGYHLFATICTIITQTE